MLRTLPWLTQAPISHGQYLHRRQRICLSLGTTSKRLNTLSAPGAQLGTHIPGRATTRRVSVDDNVSRTHKGRAVGLGPDDLWSCHQAVCLSAGPDIVGMCRPQADELACTEPLDECLGAGAVAELAGRCVAS